MHAIAPFEEIRRAGRQDFPTKYLPGSWVDIIPIFERQWPDSKAKAKRQDLMMQDIDFNAVRPASRMKWWIRWEMHRSWVGIDGSWTVTFERLQLLIGEQERQT